MPKKTYTLKGDMALILDGNRYVEGDKIKADDKDVAHLIETGRLLNPDQDKSDADNTSDNPGPDGSGKNKNT